MRERFRQNFNRNVASELRVMRLIHIDHVTCANLRGDFVRAKSCTRRDCNMAPAKREWREYTAAKPFSGKIRGEKAKS